MPTSVIFLRAVNVGGRTIRTKQLADELGLVNIGAAGTFIGGGAPRKLERSIRSALPFDTEIIVCPAQDLLALIASEPFGERSPPAGTKRSVTILARAPAKRPRLPIARPDARAWDVRVIGAEGRFVTSLRRRHAEARLYPNEVVEKELGVPATTRGWETILKIGALLDER